MSGTIPLFPLYSFHRDNFTFYEQDTAYFVLYFKPQLSKLTANQPDQSFIEINLTSGIHRHLNSCNITILEKLVSSSSHNIFLWKSITENIVLKIQYTQSVWSQRRSCFENFFLFVLKKEFILSTSNTLYMNPFIMHLPTLLHLFSMLSTSVIIYSCNSKKGVTGNHQVPLQKLYFLQSKEYQCYLIACANLKIGRLTHKSCVPNSFMRTFHFYIKFRLGCYRCKQITWYG